MPAIVGNIKQRPIKIGILIRDGNLGDLEKAASLNTLLWGGIYNPIIPLNIEDGSFAKDLLKLYNPDVLYPISDDATLTEFLDNNKKLYFGDFRIDPLFGSENKDLNYLSLLDVINNLYDDDFKHKTEGFISDFFLGRWKESDDKSVLYSILFGKIPKTFDHAEIYKDSYKKGLFATEIDLDEIDGLNNIKGKISPIQATKLRIQSYNGYRASGIFIGKKDNFLDLTNFWNLRASGIRVSYFALDDDRFRDFNKDIIQQIDDAIIDVIDEIYFYSSSDNEIYEAVKNIIDYYIDSLELKNRVITSNISKLSFNGLNIKVENKYFREELSSIGYINNTKIFNSTFPVNNRANLSESSKFKELVFSFSAGIGFELPEYTYNLPDINFLHEFYKRNIFEDKFIRSGETGIEFLSNNFHSYLHINPIKKKDIILEILKNLGSKMVELSDSGIQTHNIIKQIGDNNRDLEGGRVFKITGVRKLISSLGVNDYKTRQEAKKIIMDNGSFNNFLGLYIEKRVENKLTADMVFDFLLKYDFLSPGSNFKCKGCALKSWIGINSISKKWSCEYCGGVNITGLDLRVKWDWKFKRSGLFGKDNNQEGSIPVIITLLAFNRLLDRLGSIFYLESINLDFGGENKFEIDFCLLNQDYSLKGNRYNKSHIEIGIGEVKSKGRIEKKDIENLKFLRNKFKENEIDCYLIFSKTDECFCDEEIEMFRNLKEEKIDIILMTNREIEPYHPYWELDESNSLPYKYANSLYEMSKNSDYLYFKK